MLNAKYIGVEVIYMSFISDLPLFRSVFGMKVLELALDPLNGELVPVIPCSGL